MTHVTDSTHLAKVIQDGLATLLDAQEAWLEEDATACAPRSTGESRSRSGPGDQTASIATTDLDRYRDRDRIGSALLNHLGALQALLDDRKPRRAGGPCACCHSETATHGRSEEGAPNECWACWMYRRRMGYRCTDEVHEGRPKIRWCECDADCCEPGTCADKAAEQRTVSERCKKRVQRLSA